MSRAERVAQWRAAVACPKCGDPDVRGFVHCAACRRAHTRRVKARARRLSRRWQAVGACGLCGVPVERFKRCLTCRRNHARWALARYHRQKQRAA